MFCDSNISYSLALNRIAFLQSSQYQNILMLKTLVVVLGLLALSQALTANHEQMVCCTGGKFYDASSYSCRCPDGTSAGDSGYCCPPGTSVTPLSNQKCVCDAPNSYMTPAGKCQICDGGRILDANAAGCVCPPPYTFFSTGKCICPPGTNFIRSLNTCQACSAGKIYDAVGQQCLCPPSAQYIGRNGECNQCLSPGRWISSTYQCKKCAQGQVFDANNVCDCPPGYKRDKNNKCIVCGPNEHWSEKRRECVHCIGINIPKGAIYIQSIDGCGCPPSAHRIDKLKNQCTDCAAPRVYDEAKQQCKLCTPDTHYANGKCQCCPTGFHYSSSVQKCVCDDGLYFNSNTKQCVACQSPAIWEDKTNTCKCPDNFPYKDPVSGKCTVCPSNIRFWNGRACVGCPVGTVFSQGCGCCCNCPTGMKYSQTGCVIG